MKMTMDEQRAQNLRSINSPASMALLGLSLLLLGLAFTFYDHPLANNIPQIFSTLRGWHVTGTPQ